MNFFFFLHLRPFSKLFTHGESANKINDWNKLYKQTFKNLGKEFFKHKTPIELPKEGTS
jgi:hypothetical protein